VWLQRLTALCRHSPAPADAQIKAIHSWVFLGGGLLLGGHEWGSALPNSGINWPGNRVTMALGIVQTTDAWKLDAHSISTACPSPLLLADQAAVQLRTNATVNATASDKSLALAKVSKAMQ
jgi:hypothetical protein